MKGFDPLVWENNAVLSIIFDRYYTAPWEKGPEGTKELTLTPSWYPRSTYRGEMLESFEIKDLYTVNFKLRQGIHYWNKAPVNGREVTVDDIMWNWLRNTFHPRCGTYLKAGSTESALQYWTDFLEDIESGEVTKEMLIAHLAECKQYTPEWESYYPGLKVLVTSKYASSYSLLTSKGYDVDNLTLFIMFYHKIDNYNFVLKNARCGRDYWASPNAIWVTPREVTELDEFTNWETVVANGPWIPESFDPMGESIFVKNKDYWQYDPINTENKLPYLDKLVILVIEDESTYYAALQTGQLDIGVVEWYRVQEFKDNYPEMKYQQVENAAAHCLFVRNDIPPFSDIRVRHACMLGIDHQAFLNHYQGTAQLLCWPEQMSFPAVYTPLNQLPAATQELFTYNPSKAKQLLADAGYPDGFETTLTVAPTTEDKESCQIFQNYMKDIGIDVSLNTPDYATWAGILFGRAYEHMISLWYPNTYPGNVLAWAEGGALNSPYNFGNIVDDLAYQTYLAIQCMWDDNEYNAAIKADNVRRLGMMYEILLPTPVGSTFWWPWLVNYSGEADLGWPELSNWGEIPKYLWIDQDLKDDMGY
jgi:ABC-type transport system substrate-binding protein